MTRAYEFLLTWHGVEDGCGCGCWLWGHSRLVEARLGSGSAWTVVVFHLGMGWMWTLVDVWTVIRHGLATWTLDLGEGLF